MHLIPQVFDCRKPLHVLSTIPMKSQMPNPPQKPGSITRRSFTTAAVAAATAALIQPAQALGTTTGIGLQDEKSADAAMAKLSPNARAEVEMKLNSIFRKYGDRLNDEQKVDMRKAMAETQSGLEKMRAFQLENSDLPATIFRAGEGSEKA
jgi:hypothetical protein